MCLWDVRMWKRTTIATTAVVVSNSSSGSDGERKREGENPEDINSFSYSDAVGIKRDRRRRRKKKERKKRLFLSIGYPIVACCFSSEHFFSFCGNATNVGGNHLHRRDGDNQRRRRREREKDQQKSDNPRRLEIDEDASLFLVRSCFSLAWNWIWTEWKNLLASVHSWKITGEELDGVFLGQFPSSPFEAVVPIRSQEKHKALAIYC